MEGYYTAIIHTETGGQYMTYDHLSDLYAYLNTINYTYADIYCAGILIHHKTGPCVPLMRPTCAPHAPHMIRAAAEWLKKKLFNRKKKS